MAKALSYLNVGDKLEVDVKPEHWDYLGKTIVWKVADKNHAGYPTNSVTLITDKIPMALAFDAKEPSNSDANRKNYGNNRYLYSNIRQWLNSKADAGEWYTAQYQYDAPPTVETVDHNSYNTKAGFLAMLDDNFVAALMNTTLTVAKNTVADGGGSETVISKMFLASNTEVGLANENNIAEGSKLALFSNNTSRLAYPTTQCVSNSNYTNSDFNTSVVWYWWLRTPHSINSHVLFHISSSGTLSNVSAHIGQWGVRPLCNLPNITEISDNLNSNGCYTLVTPSLKKLGQLNVGDTIEVPVKEEHQARYGKKIVWKIADKNHTGYPANSTTVITDKIISLQCFDAKEPTNPDADRQKYGNNRWSYSNIRQWLNSDKLAGEWYTAQHVYDEPPIAENVSEGYNPYNNLDGFLRILPDGLVSKMYESSIATIIPNVDGAGVEYPINKMFLPSTNEVGLTTGGEGEGTLFPLFSNDISRFAYPTQECVSNSNYISSGFNASAAWYWWLRTPYSGNSCYVRNVYSSGALSNGNAYVGNGGVRPCCNLPNDLLLSPLPNEEGNYTLSNEHTITVTSPGGYAKVPSQTVKSISAQEVNVTFDLPQSPPVIILGVKIDVNNPDPEGALEYTDDAVGMTPGSDDWFSVFPFNEIYPCVLNGDGTEKWKLNKQDITKKEDGTAGGLTGQALCMTRFPQIWISITEVGSYTHVRIANAKVDDTYESLNDIRGGEHKEQVYIGMFEGTEANSVSPLISTINKTPVVSKTLDQFREKARANGKGFEVNTWFNHIMLQCLFLIFYKDRNSQACLGQGLVNMTAMSNAGTSVSYPGANYGNPSNGTSPLKFLWIENPWGNVFEAMEGVYFKPDNSPSSSNPGGFATFICQPDVDLLNSNGSGYTPAHYLTKDANVTGYLSMTTSGTSRGFLPRNATSAQGSSSTYWCDNFGSVVSNGLQVIYVSSKHTPKEGTGMFYLGMSTMGSASAVVSARLCFI